MGQLWRLRILISVENPLSNCQDTEWYFVPTANVDVLVEWLQRNVWMKVSGMSETKSSTFSISWPLVGCHAHQILRCTVLLYQRACSPTVNLILQYVAINVSNTSSQLWGTMYRFLLARVQVTRSVTNSWLPLSQSHSEISITTFTFCVVFTDSSCRLRSAIRLAFTGNTLSYTHQTTTWRLPPVHAKQQIQHFVRAKKRQFIFPSLHNRFQSLQLLLHTWVTRTHETSIRDLRVEWSVYLAVLFELTLRQHRTVF